MAMRPHTYLFAALALLSLVFGPVSPTFSHPAQARSLEHRTWYGYTDVWHQSDYSVMRFTPEAGITFIEPLNSDTLVEQGLLAVVPADSSWLYLYNEADQRLYKTNAQLPYTGWQARSQTPYVALKDGQIMTQQNGDIYFMDPITFEQELWVTRDVLEGYTGTRTWYESIIGNELYLYGGKHSSGTDGRVYHVTAPNQFTLVDALPARDAHAPLPASSSFPYLHVTGSHSGMLAGLIEEGVYVANGPTLTKVGYTDYKTNGWNLGGTYTSRKEPRFVGDHSIGWIGVDGALYIADWSERTLEHTGVQDIPRGVPFRSISSSKVYFHDTHATTLYGGVVIGTYHFANEADYYDVLNTTDFQDVVWLPDAAVNHQVLGEWIQTTNETTIADPFRDVIYNKHR